MKHRIWHSAILINLVLVSIWMSVLLSRLPSGVLAIVLIWLSVLPIILSSFGVNGDSSWLQKWSAFCSTRPWAQVLVLLLLISNVVSPIWFRYQVIFSSNISNPQGIEVDQLSDPMPPDSKSAIWQPLNALNPKFDALLRGTTMYFEAKELSDTSDISEVYQKYRDAEVAYKQANDSRSLIPIYLELAEIYRPDEVSELEQLRLKLGYHQVINYLFLRYQYRRWKMSPQSDSPLSDLARKEIEQADVLFENAWELFQDNKCNQATSLFSNANKIYRDLDFELEKYLINTLSAYCKSDLEGLNELGNIEEDSSMASNFKEEKLLAITFAARQFLLAKENYNHREWGTAIESYKISLTGFEDSGHSSGIAHTMFELGNTYLMINDYSEAQNWYERTLNLFKELQDNQSQAATHYNLALAHLLSQQPNYAKAQSEFEASKRLWDKSSKDAVYDTYTMHGFGYILWKQNSRAQAITIFRDLRQNSFDKQLKDPEIKGDILMHLGCVYFDQERFYEASATFSDARNEYSSVSNTYPKLKAQLNLGLALEAQQNFQTALETYTQVASVAEKENLPEVKLPAIKRIEFLQKHTGIRNNNYTIWIVTLLAGFIAIVFIARYFRNRIFSEWIRQTPIFLRLSNISLQRKGANNIQSGLELPKENNNEEQPLP